MLVDSDGEPSSLSASPGILSPTWRKRVSQLVAAPLVALTLTVAGLGGPGAAHAEEPSGIAAQFLEMVRKGEAASEQRPAQPNENNDAPVQLARSEEVVPTPADSPASPPPAEKEQTRSEHVEEKGSGLKILGVPHTIQRGETLEGIAELYRVPVADIIGFAPNELVAGAPLPDGVEIFIPGATPLLPSSVVVSRRELEPSGLVFGGRSNVRKGPDLVYPRVASVDEDQYVRLLGRHKNWYKVQLRGGRSGWMSAEVLMVPGYVKVRLKEVTEFPPRPTWVWPAEGAFTSGFGWRLQPWHMFHDGIDIANAEGTSLLAVRDGTVTIAGWCSGYGYCVKIEHDNGFESLYGHMASEPLVKAGNKVEAGQVIGLMGNTYDLAGGGYSTGVHLHFTLRQNGVPVDPLRYLPRP